MVGGDRREDDDEPGIVDRADFDPAADRKGPVYFFEPIEQEQRHHCRAPSGPPFECAQHGPEELRRKRAGGSGRIASAGGLATARRTDAAAPAVAAASATKSAPTATPGVS